MTALLTPETAAAAVVALGLLVLLTLAFAAGAFRGAPRPCDRCRDIGLLTYDELTPAERKRAGHGSVFPCPSCRQTRSVP